MVNSKYEFISTVRGFINTAIPYIPFSFGNVRRLDINNKFMYLWQDAKGNVYYCFSLFEKKPHTTSATKLGNVLTGHFECQIEAVNNEKEHLKKISTATASLNKALSDSEQQSYYASLQHPNLLQLDNHSTAMDILSDNQLSQPRLHSTTPQEYQKHPLQNQDELIKGVVQLSTYSLESHLNTIYIKINELPIIHKDVYAPYSKQAFFIDENGLNCKNNFISTEYMLKPLYYCDPEQSFTVKFIVAMANNNITQALKILAWITDSFTSLNKLPFALVLYSTDDAYMKLFYDEIVVPLLNINECEKIESDSLDKKSLSEKLDQNFIYNLHNITVPTILGEPAHELTNRLIHKEMYKLNNKVVTTVANILITSTTSYIPLISEDVPTAIVNVSSSIDDLCNEFGIRSNPYEVANLIKNDRDNFVNIMRCIDLNKLCNECQVIDDTINDVHADILDGNADPVEVFNKIIRNKDTTPFKLAATTKKEEKLVEEELEGNFNLNRVDKNHLLDYFEILFGKSIYKSNTAFIRVLRDDYSETGEPFDDYQTHVRKGRGYYIIE